MSQANNTLSEVSIHNVDASSLTPAMRQYQQYKVQHPDAILFFRMGDFYELFYEDARTAARVLGLALTARSKGENAVPMAGVPFHSVETYLQRMIAAGYKVAICEQMEDPKTAKGVVKREVTRLVTPGTLVDETMLNGREENFIAAVVVGSQTASGADAAIAWCELSTGKFLTMEAPLGACLDELARLGPREILLAEQGDHRLPEWAMNLKTRLGAVLTARPAWQLGAHHAVETLKNHYGVARFEGFGYTDEKSLALCAAGAVVTYLHETQKTALEHLRPPRDFSRSAYLMIDPTSLRSLEILRTIRGGSADGSLAWALDDTRTPMGSRLLRNWICYPLRDVAQIRRRHDAIGQLMEHESVLDEVRRALSDCSDIERIAARICCRRVSPRDFNALSRSLESLANLTAQLASLEEQADHWAPLVALAPESKQIATRIKNCICDEPPSHCRDGNVIRDGFNAELDRLRTMSRDSRSFLANYQAKLIAECDIPSLKVGYNKVFGFYIEITHTHSGKIPDSFTRKQTVKNAERYITPELKQYESEILTAQERSVALEQDLLEQLRVELAASAEKLQQIAQAAATLDVIACGAELARKYHYVRPEMTTEKELVITDGRHPVVDQTLGEKFVPNDTRFGQAESDPAATPNAANVTLHLITGPNMAGKSTYIRQVALLVLMAQAGLYIPAASARVGIVDRLFTRVGASDDLAGGQSTFMVEMSETANILNHATENSLVILDEIGRGTSTLDGLALAWAIAEFLADTTKARTLFATHYHEITELAETNPAVANYNVLVREWEDQVIFMHRIGPGAAGRSYGVHVARLAGVPRSVVTRARQLMSQLQVNVGKPGGRASAARTNVAPQMNMFDTRDQQAITQLRALDMERISPMQAWEALRALQAMLAEKNGK